MTLMLDLERMNPCDNVKLLKLTLSETGKTESGRKQSETDAIGPNQVVTCRNTDMPGFEYSDDGKANFKQDMQDDDITGFKHACNFRDVDGPQRLRSDTDMETLEYASALESDRTPG